MLLNLLPIAASQESSLARWGDIFAIVGGAIAAILLAFALLRWAIRQITGSDLRYGLAPVYLDPQYRLFRASGEARLEVGVGLINAKDFPISYRAVECTVSVGAVASLYDGEWTSEIPARQQHGFWRDPITVPISELGGELVISYRFEYGFAGKPPRRFVAGRHHHATVIQSGAAPGERADIPVVHRSYSPVIDGAIGPRWRFWRQAPP
jgi:hypothetical protein